MGGHEWYNKYFALPENDFLRDAIDYAQVILFNQGDFFDEPERAKPLAREAMPYLKQYRSLSPYCDTAIKFIEFCEDGWRKKDEEEAERQREIEEQQAKRKMVRREVQKNYNDLFVSIGRRDGFACANCGDNEDLQIDHIIPVSKGGTNELGNLQILCGPCNLAKSDKM